MPRNFGGKSVVSDDNTGRVLELDYLAPAYAASIAVAPNASLTFFKPAALTGNLALTATVSNSQVGDILVAILTASGGNRTVTPGSGITKNGTNIVIADGTTAALLFVFDGTTFVEVGTTSTP